MDGTKLLSLIEEYGNARSAGSAASDLHATIVEAVKQIALKREVVTRKQATERGLLTYFDGRVCRRGGDAGRRTSDGKCICEKCRAAHVADSMQRYKTGTEAWLKKCKQRKESRKSNKELLALDAKSRREWKQANPDAVRAQKQKRRAAKRQALPAWYGEFDELVAREACDLAERRRELTDMEWDVDHMLPLRAKTVCGLHIGANLQVIPHSLNLRKGNKLLATKPGEWLLFS